MAILYDLAAEYGASIISDSDTTAPALALKTGVATQPALAVSRTVAGSQTVSALKIEGSSLASGALVNFAGGFISLTSVIFTSAAHFDYAIPVQVGVETRYIPVLKGTGLSGSAAF